MVCGSFNTRYEALITVPRQSDLVQPLHVMSNLHTLTLTTSLVDTIALICKHLMIID